jgi:YcxB-like protein
MTSTGPETDFSLTYELQPDDLQDLFATRPERKRRRARVIYATVIWALLDAALTAVTVALDLPSVVKNSPGAPSWMYVVDATIWLFVINGAIIVWRLSPKRLVRRAWRSSTQLHGRHHDEVGPGGITYTQPDGLQIVTPWNRFDYIRETEHAFHLIDHRGATQTTLPKRGLPSPDLIPALREFLNRSVNGQLSTAASDSAVG